MSANRSPREIPERAMTANSPDQAESFARPRRRRVFRTLRPARVRIRRRNPCFLLRFRWFGWKVRFTHGLLERVALWGNGIDPEAWKGGPAERKMGGSWILRSNRGHSQSARQTSTRLGSKGPRSIHRLWSPSVGEVSAPPRGVQITHATLWIAPQTRTFLNSPGCRAPLVRPQGVC
jgi:hypothetical protein